MEDLIKQAFAHVEVTSPHVQEGHYDLIGPDGEIILPIVWDKTVQPGWQISMRMWPMDKHPLPGPPRPGHPMTPEQHMQFMMEQHRRRRAAAAQHGGQGVPRGRRLGGKRVRPMRTLSYTGGARGRPPTGNGGGS